LTTQHETKRASAAALPIRIRRRVTVEIAHLPLDLSQSEAAKIAAVIMAMAQPKDDAA
jgi:hypothetical protein